MKNRLFTLLTVAAYFAVLITMASCEGKKDDKKEDSPKTVKPGDTTPPATDAFSTDLYVLWIGTNVFEPATENGSRIIFKFYVDDTKGSPVFLNLHGWQSRTGTAGNDFESTGEPTIKLERGEPSGLKIDSKTYLGNVVIREIRVNALRRNKDHKTHIVFYPEKNAKGHIRYNYKFENLTSPPFTDKTVVNPDGRANPSPPRRYDGDQDEQ